MSLPKRLFALLTVWRRGYRYCFKHNYIHGHWEHCYPCGKERLDRSEIRDKQRAEDLSRAKAVLTGKV